MTKKLQKNVQIHKWIIWVKLVKDVKRDYNVFLKPLILGVSYLHNFYKKYMTDY